MMKSKKYAGVAHMLPFGMLSRGLSLLLASCTFGDNFDVDFSSLPSDPSMFKVTSQRTSTLDELPADCYIEGVPAAEYGQPTEQSPMWRTSSTTAASVMQEILDFSNRRTVIELSGTYWSVDEEWNDVQLSGKVVLPADGKAERIILVSHYTIGSNAEAPSRCFPIEAMLAKMGYVMIFPDYLGYGVTADRVHPYLVMDLTAINVLDMYLAVRPFLEAAGVEVAHDEILLMGYSQGGATTMAVQHLIEAAYYDEIKIRRVFAGGGPYDVLATYDHFVTRDTADYPIAVPLVMQGMIVGNHLDLNMGQLMQPYVYENMDYWVNSKQFTTAQLNKAIGTKITHNILSEKGMDRTSEEVSELYKAMTSNSILSYSWEPQAPVYLFHSMDDEVVTFANASRARVKWTNANIQYNFGHYGGHIQGYLRFVSSVKTLLEQDREIK